MATIGMDASGEDRDGKWNVACAFLIFFAVLGIPAIMMPVLYGPIIDETGWSRGDVALLSSLKFGAGAIAAYLTGPLVERFGVRPVTILCSILSGIALLMMVMVDSLLMLYAVGIFLGISALGVTTAMKILVSQWFSRNQGLAIGIALMGTSVAGVIVPYVTTLLTEDYGWRMTCAIMSLGIWVVALPFFIWRARERSAEQTAAAVQQATLDNPDAPSFADIRFSRLFITAAIINVLIGMVDHGMSTHLVIYLDRDVHLGAGVAAIGFSAVMVMSNIGKAGYGWLFDRFSVRGVAFCWFIVAAGVAMTFPIAGTATLLLFAFVYGPTQGGMMINVPILAKHVFGPRAMARAIAVLTTFFMAGSAIGPALAGYLYDATGSYHLPFAIFIVSALVAGVLTLTIRPAFRPVREEAAKPATAN
ncbi:MAG: MFS transporter [Sphingopyxis sp.]|uniref:MFS transporter n=1 Tax=Sphingopyxis sp. TaxID=1908224 RepID=UPI002ABBDD7F|nr:MFS transporter [Sphingopyxis sp.]MDZ3832848.1 MFS transporter [Sphingopyxis sp.]